MTDSGLDSSLQGDGSRIVGRPYLTGLGRVARQPAATGGECQRCLKPTNLRPVLPSLAGCRLAPVAPAPKPQFLWIITHEIHT